MDKVKFSAFKIAVWILVFFCGLTDFGCVAQDLKDRDKELYRQIELFSDAITIIRSDYVEETESKKLVYGALEGMLASLDGYSQFMDPESFNEMEIETKGEFGGLGIEIGIREGVLTVIAPIDGTPAQKAGLKARDRIVKINGKLTKDIKLTEAVKKLRGKPGTKVQLTVLREDGERLLDFTVERDIIKLESIKTAKMVTKDIGYVKLIEFQENTSRELEEKLLKLKEEGMEALILDLRNNPGGLLDMATEVSSIFLPKGKVIVSLKGRLPKQNKVYRSRGKANLFDLPLVVMVNGGSASASEIVAGAIQDNRRGLILGTETFGKGSVQTVVPLKDGSALRLTTAAYYTPLGHNIMNKGIKPDVEVKPREEEEDLRKEEDIFKRLEEEKRKPEEKPLIHDSQLRAAIDILRGILLYKTQTAG